MNTKRLMVMARKSQKKSAAFRRTVSMGKSDNGGESGDVCSTSSVASKGHVFIYTIEGKRFMVPLEYINHNTFREPFKISEKEFGLPSDGPITLPCDATCVEYIIYLLCSWVSRDVERSLLTFIANVCCKDSFPQHDRTKKQLILYGY